MDHRAIKPPRMVVRCFAQRDGKQWVAVCVDFNLAAQAGSFVQAKKKLHEQIVSYVRDIINGDDAAFAHQLFNRRAPASIMARYYLILALTRVHRMQGRLKSFFEPVPLAPVPLCA